MVLNKLFKLNTGGYIPALGLGTWQSTPDSYFTYFKLIITNEKLEVSAAVEAALQAGYRHIGIIRNL
ncbi:hypothetical protein MERGE_000909 [Pneumocystis wakefieldiae]|uniref:NADP-dependent oxidoreductase domain-containing protein n=1 Tax=Pneumocystis wakefieldiae TaxID=38082 RepID=A0A899G517_9ASCO|nr:hypothetical protein MERGE_000909 [Pneumocystis wakefieldiae]